LAGDAFSLILTFSRWEKEQLLDGGFKFVSHGAEGAKTTILPTLRV